MNILLFGPQGSGKGTQARLLCDHFGFFYFESGAYLRKIAETNESLKKIMDSGQLVPDLEMASYVTAYLDSESLYDNIIFDGFPRTINQYDFLKKWLKDKEVKLDIVLVLEISKAETIKRLVLRKKIERRGDDNPEAIEKRLSIYSERTEKLINEMRKTIKVVEVNGERPVDEIANDLEKIIKGINNYDSN